MAKKDPALEKDSEFDDDFFSELDMKDSDLSGIDVDFESFDSEKNREPVGKLKSVTADLRHVGRSAMGGAATGIAMRLKHELPEVTSLAGEAIDVISEAKRFKDDVVRDIRPTINQTKLLSRQMLKYGNDFIPTGIYDKLMKMLDVPEEDRIKNPSVEESRQMAQEQALAKISKVQMKERILTRQQEASDRLITEKLTASRHTELANMVNDIRNQSFYHTNFLRSAFTAYMRKDLELKYRHMYLAEDTLETLRITSQMMEKRLDAIRHNTSLPDSQKIRLIESMKEKTRNKLIDGFQNTVQNYASGIFGKIKDNFVTPAKDMLGSGNDMLEGLASMLDMNAEMGEKFNAKKSILGHIGGAAGGFLGSTVVDKLMAKLPDESRKVISRHAAMGKQGLILLAEQIRRGETTFEGSETLQKILDPILPEIDRTGGKFENDVYSDPNAPGAITKKFTLTVEEIIPGYLAKQVSLLEEMISGKKSEELAFDFKKRDFVRSSDLRADIYTQAFGTEESRGSVLKGNADAVREALLDKGERAQATFEEVAKEVSIFMVNLSNSKAWANIRLDELRDVAKNGRASSEYAEVAFRGIDNKQEVATALLSLLTNSDGSVNEGIRSSMELRISRAMTQVSDKHRAAMHDAVFKFGYGRHISNMIRANEYGEMQVDDTTRLAQYDTISKDNLSSDYEYIYDEFGKKRKEKTALEKIVEASKGSTIIGDTLEGVRSGIDSGLTSLTTSMGKADEYTKLKRYLNTKFDVLCKFLQDKKKNVSDFASDIKNKIIFKAHEWLKKSHNFKIIADTLFNEDGTLKEKVSPIEWADLLARVPKLHGLLQRIHKADTAIMFVLDSMLPHSCQIVAEMTQEEVDDILQSDNPEEKIADALGEKIDAAAPKKARRKSKKKQIADAVEATTEKTKRISRKNQKAEGGTIDEVGEPVGTISEPTLIADGNALAGEAGKETIVPLNKTESAKQAYLEAKAYHEGKTFAKGGTVDEDGKKISTTIGNFIDNNINKGTKATAKKLRELDFQDDAANEDVRIVAKRLGKTRVNTTKKLEAAQAKVEALYAELSSIDAKASFTKISAAIIKFCSALIRGDLWEHISPADRVLITRIRECLDKKDMGLSKIRAISKDTTPAFKKAVKFYQEAYVRGEEKIGEIKDWATETVGEVKETVTKKTDEFVSYAKDKAAEVSNSKFVKRGKEMFQSGLDHTKQFFNSFTESMQPLLKNDHGSLVDIASEQLTTQKSILDILGSKFGGTTTKYVHKPMESGKDGERHFDNFWQEAAYKLGKTTKSLVYDKPLAAAQTIVRNSLDSTKGLLLNKKVSVYRKPAAGQKLGRDLLLISAEDFASGVFFDPEGKKRVKSVMDINKPVYDGNGKMLISESDLDQGLVDENEKPIRSLGGRLGRSVRGTITGSARLAGTAISKTYDTVRNSNIVSKTVDVAAVPFNVVSSVVQKWVDVYCKGQAEPLVTARDLKNGRLTFVDGKPIPDSYSISRPLVWVDVPENGEKRGNIAISWDDIDAGLVNRSGKPLNRFGNMVGSALRGAAGLVGRGIGMLGGGIAGVVNFAKNVAVGGVKAVFAKANPYVDVYVPDDKGDLQIGHPKMTGANIRLKRYVYADGRPVKSAYGIEEPVLDAETGNTVITEEDLKRGLVDSRGRKLSKFAGKSVAGKILSGAVGAVGWGLKKTWGGIRAIGRGIAKGVQFLTKGVFDKGADIVDYMHGAFTDILNTVFQKENVRRQDLEDIVGARLDKVYNLLNTRMPGKAAGDADGDGVRDGSYQDQQQKKAAKAEARSKKSKAAAAMAAAGAASAKDKKEAKDEGGMLDGAADAKAAWDWAKETKIGRGIGKAKNWIGGKIGGAARFLGSKGMGLATSGITALANTGIGTAVTGMASTAMTSLATAGGAILGTAGSALASAGSALGTAALGLASNPVGWAIAAGLLLYGGYKLCSYLFGESDAEKDWRELRHKYYGTDPEKHKSVIEDLEKRTLKTFDKEEPGLTKEELEDFAKEFGLVDTGFLGTGIGGNDDAGNKERMDYFTTWYSARFSPIFREYVQRVRIATDTYPGDKLKPQDMEEERAKFAREYFIKQATSIEGQGNTKELIPTEEGFQKFKKKEEEKKKQSEKPAAATAADIVAGITAATAVPKKDDPEKEKSKTQQEIDKATAASAKTNSGAGKVASTDLQKPTFTSIVGDTLKWATATGILTAAGYKVFSWLFGDSDEVLMWKTLKHQYYGTTEDKHRSALKDLESRVQETTTGKKSELEAADLEEYAEKFGLIDRGVKIGVIVGPRVGGDDAATIKSRMEYFTSWYALRFRPIFQTYLSVVHAYAKTNPNDKANPDDIPEDMRKQAQDAFRKEGDKLISGNPQVKDLVPSLEGFIEYLKKKQKEAELKKSKAGENSPSATRKTSEEAILAKVGMATAPKKGDTDDDKEDEKKQKSLADAKLEADLAASKQAIPQDKATIDPRKQSGHAAAVAARATVFQATPDMKVDASDLQKGVGTAGGAGAYAQQQTGSGPAPNINPESLKAANIPDGGSGDLGSYMKKFESGTEGASNISWDSTGGTSYGTYQFAAKKGGLQAFLEWASKNGGDFGKKLVAAMSSAGRLDTGCSKGAAPDVWRQFAKVEGDPLGKLEQNFTYEKVYKVALAGIKNPKAKALIMEDRGLQEALWSTAVGHGIGGAPSLFMKVYKDGMTAEQWITAIYKERPTRYQSSTPKIQASMANRYAKELPIMLGLSKAKSKAQEGAGAATTGGQNDSGSGGGEMSANTLATAGAGMMTGNQSGSGSGSGGGGGEGDASADAGSGEGKSGWKRPTDSPVITSPFGPRNVPGGSKNHKGIDLRARTGEPIYAAKDGTVEAAGGSYNSVVLKHEGGEGSKYLHLSQLKVRAGQQVKEGQVIGLSGGAGPKGPNQYPAHLHFEILKGGKPIDPEPFMKAAGISLNRKGEKGNEGMAPQSDADATPKTGNEQSADDLAKKEANAGNTDAKTSGGSSGSTTGTDQSQAADIAQQSASVAKEETEKKLDAAYGGGSGSESSAGAGGTPSGGGSMPSTPAPSNTSTSGTGGEPQVQTNTPSQTGQIGPDITANAQLEQLKTIVQILSGLRDDCKGYFGNGATGSSSEAPSGTANEATASSTPGVSQQDVTAAVQQAFTPGSPAFASIQSLLSGFSQHTQSTQPIQNQPVPQGVDRTTMRMPINVSKKPGSAFQM